MPNKASRTISRDTSLKALALFTVANQAYVKAREMQLAMDEVLGLEDGSWPAEILYRDDVLASCGDFDKALEKENITVEEATRLPLHQGKLRR